MHITSCISRLTKLPIQYYTKIGQIISYESMRIICGRHLGELAIVNSDKSTSKTSSNMYEFLFHLFDPKLEKTPLSIFGPIQILCSRLEVLILIIV